MMLAGVTFVCRWTANFTLDRTAGSHSLAAAGQRGRYPDGTGHDAGVERRSPRC